MAENQKTPEELAQDAELAKAQRSMGGRVDSDTVTTDTTQADADKKAADEAAAAKAKADEDAAKIAAEGAKKSEDAALAAKAADDATKKPDETGAPSTTPARPEKYIPMAKYHDEKKQWEIDRTEKERLATRVKELEDLANRPDSAKKDEDLAAMADALGMDDETFAKLVELVDKRSASAIPKDRLDRLEQLEKILFDKELADSFDTEFASQALPDLQKRYPNATPEQIRDAKVFLDQVSHSATYKSQKIGYVIYDQATELDKIFAAPAPVEDAKPADQRSVETGRNGGGKPVSVTAADLKTSKDFQVLENLDSAEVSKIVKDMDRDTYLGYIAYEKSKSEGVEVMRNGRKIVLK